MKRVLTLAVAAAIVSVVVAVGCADDEGSVGPDDKLDADAGARGDVGSLSVDAGSLSVDAGSRSDAGVGGGGGGPVVITGVVSSIGSTGVNTPLAGATVEIAGASPANVTTSGADGRYSFSVMPGTYFVRASKLKMLTAQLGVATSVSTVVSEIGLLNTTTAALLALQAGQSINKNLGILAVDFVTSDTGGGYGVTLKNSTSHGVPIALDVSGNPTESERTLKGGANSLILLNVSLGATTVTLVAPLGHTCTASLPMTEYRIDADVVTAVIADCH